MSRGNGLDRPGVCYQFCTCVHTDLACRTKEQLRSGERMVSGDQWPLFLYSDCEFDPEDPWRGLFKSSILVSVSYTFLGTFLSQWHNFWRPINMFSRRLVLSTTHLRRHVLVMLKFMGWNTSLPHQSPILPLRYDVTFGYVSYASLYCWEFIGSICAHFLGCIFPDRHRYRFRTLLHQCDGIFWWLWWADWSRWSFGVVESVRYILLINHTTEANCYLGGAGKYFLVI
jgi:hypothetical protein